MGALGVPAGRVLIDGEEKALDVPTARRSAALVARVRSRRRAAWLEGLSFPREMSTAGREPRARGLV